MKKKKKKKAPKKSALSSKTKKSTDHIVRRRGVWKGSIVFGLVNIPIYLESAEQDRKIHFRLLDKHNHSPVGYRQYNKSSGKDISCGHIVKGYEYENGQYVLMSDVNFKKSEHQIHQYDGNRRLCEPHRTGFHVV